MAIILDLPTVVAIAIPNLYNEARIVEYAGVAAATWTIYDYAITLGDEIEHIWWSPWTISKFCFLFSRYFGTLAIQAIALGAPAKWSALRDETAFNDNICIGISLFKAITGLLLGLSVEIIMLLRVHALYGSDRRILIFLVAAYIVEFATVSTMIGVTLQDILVTRTPDNPVPSPLNAPLTDCNPSMVPIYFSAYWIAMILFQSTLFAMMLTTKIRVGFARRGLGDMIKTPILNMFFRDGTVFYALILATLLVNLVLCKIFNSPISQVAVCLHLAVMSVSCSRIILNMRTLAADSNSVPGSINEVTIGSIRFRQKSVYNTFGSPRMSPGSSFDSSQTI